MGELKRYLLAQRNCVELYPPVLHQAELLSKAAHIILLDAPTEMDSNRALTNGGVNRIRVYRSKQPSRIKSLNSRVLWLLNYIKVFRKLYREKTDAVIAYDADASSLLLSRRKSKSSQRHVVHLHELPVYESEASLFKNLNLKYLLMNLHRADLVITPDYNRAKYIKSVAKLPVMPTVVMNCPLILKTLPESLLVPFLEAAGIKNRRIAHYQGAVGPGHGLEQVISSMSMWPSESIFVVVGGGKESYLDTLKSLARELGVSERVVFVGRVPYNQVLQYGVGATVGVTILNPLIPNWRFSAGASNKRFEYAALGVPQVTNDGPGINELFVQPGIAKTVNHQDVKDIGRGISFYLENDRQAKGAGETARQLHLSQYNYERQFQTVLDWLQK